LKPDLREQQARLATLLQERGPRITEIARELKESPETVRYWFKNNILSHKGIVFQAVPNYEGMGFKRIQAIIDFADEYLTHAKAVLVALNQLCYLTYCFRIFPSGYYSVLLTVPSELEGAYVKLLEDIDGTGMFRLIELNRLDWVRVSPMDARYFDFSSGRWDFDWSAVVNDKRRPRPGPPFNFSSAIDYDYEDLLILEKLQTDATRSLGKISKMLKIPYSQVYSHYGHIEKSGQVALFRIRWPATGPRSQEELKAWQQHHAHIALEFLVRNSNDSEQREILNKMERLPFMWSSGGGPGIFHSSFIIPLEYYSETFQYLSEALVSSRGRTEFFIGDQANSLSFTIPTRLFYDKETDAWVNNADDALAGFKKLAMSVKKR
jgi:DNA-binding Lrp family transcriptional regulator